MNKEDYVKIINEKLEGIGRDIMLNQLDNYYEAKEYVLPNIKYKIGDKVYLKKGTLIHGTDRNLDGLKGIVKEGLNSSWFLDARTSKYPSSVGVFTLKKDYYLKDYLNYTNGATVKFNRLVQNGEYTNNSKTCLISYDDMKNINEILSKDPCWMWYTEQTKEARFLPSIVQDMVQVAVIFNGENEYTKKLLKYDILEADFMTDEEVKPFVNESYYDRFIKERINKDDFFTNRESAILFGIPSSLIEGVLVGRIYESDESILKEIKELLPNAYICNIDGTIIY